MSVFMLCERAVGILRGKRLILSGSERAMLEALNYEGLAAGGAQEEAVTCARHFAAVRDTLLFAHPWVFARKETALAELAANPIPRWKHAYAPPAGMVKLLALVPGNPGKNRSFWTAFEVIGGTIFTDLKRASAIYTAGSGNTAEWDPLFREAFCYLLASEISMAVSGDAGFISACLRQAETRVAKAKEIESIAMPGQRHVRLPGYQDYSGVRSR